jgi:diaminohydroxyphosphoribosylaminopyrimidine deaminase/5-amino-6-(5-phosphoribosylamino)uracil reductase
LQVNPITTGGAATESAIASSDRDERFMRQALELALKGVGKVSPNPLVGALIVKKDRIIGRGYHARFGGNHAEVNAIGKNDVADSTLYVTLEPCNHHGKTPPCTEKIIASGIKRVVIGTVDPNPRMQGKSIAFLKSKGLQVDAGILKEEAQELIRFYTRWINRRVPYLTIKLAVTRDGFIADSEGNSKWISGFESRRDVHRLRSEYDAVIVGTKTILIDNPRLTVRHVSGRNPNRVILDRQGILSPDLKVFSPNTRRIFYFSSVHRKDLPDHVSQVTLNHHEFNLSRIMKILGERDQQSLLVEGGATIAMSLLKSDLCSEIILYRSGATFGDGVKFPETSLPEYGFKVMSHSTCSQDEKITYRKQDV